MTLEVLQTVDAPERDPVLHDKTAIEKRLSFLWEERERNIAFALQAAEIYEDDVNPKEEEVAA